MKSTDVAAQENKHREKIHRNYTRPTYRAGRKKNQLDQTHTGEGIYGGWEKEELVMENARSLLKAHVL